jgi:hypothetical protein
MTPVFGYLHSDGINYHVLPAPHMLSLLLCVVKFAHIDSMYIIPSLINPPSLLLYAPAVRKIFNI